MTPSPPRNWKPKSNRCSRSETPWWAHRLLPTMRPPRFTAFPNPAECPFTHPRPLGWTVSRETAFLQFRAKLQSTESLPAHKRGMHLVDDCLRSVPKPVGSHDDDDPPVGAQPLPASFVHPDLLRVAVPRAVVLNRHLLPPERQGHSCQERSSGIPNHHLRFGDQTVERESDPQH